MQEYIWNLIKRYKVLVVLTILIVTFVYIANNHENSYKLIKKIKYRITEKSRNNIELNKNSFLLFKNREAFDIWLTEINFKAGYPQYSRNFKTDKIDDDFMVNNLTYCISKTDTSDKRVICPIIYDNRYKKFFAKEYENKYNYVIISRREAENYGFISDEINLHNREEYTVTCTRFKKIKWRDDIYKQHETEKYNQFTGFNISILTKPEITKETFNQYIFDYGDSIIQNKNRISAYFNSEKKLCFRVIDSLSNAFILIVVSDFDKKLLYLSFQYEILDNTLRISINNDETFSHQFKHINFPTFIVNQRIIDDISKDYIDYNFGVEYSPFWNHDLVCGNSLNSYYGLHAKYGLFEFEFVKFLRLINRHVIINLGKINFQNLEDFYINSYGISGIKQNEPIIEIE